MYTLIIIFIFFVLYGLSLRLMSYVSLIIIGFFLMVKQTLPQITEYWFMMFMRSLPPHWNTFTICICVLLVMIIGLLIGYAIAIRIRNHFDASDTE